MANKTLSAHTVIVGAGASGAVIAARLTEASDRDVLLLEAGPDYPPDVPLPEDLANGKRNSYTKHDWGYRHLVRTGYVSVPMPRGRVVGGSSAVNTCVALRGVPEDYDEWAANGLPEWSFARCLPAFRRLETDRDVHNAWHGTDGPIPVRRHPARELVPWQAAFLEACVEAGYPRCDDHNEPGAVGAGAFPMNKIDGVRMSAARCYLTASVRARAALRILPDTLVRRVLFDGRRVRGVEIERHGERITVTANRVVLCAGAIATPGVLLRSGVGPARDLERLGVTPVATVPAVGARLLDHPGCAFFLLARRGSVHRDDALLQSVLRWRGPHSDRPGDVQIQPGSIVHLPHVTLPLVSLMIHVGKPRGHGRVRFLSADPHERPVIESRFFEHPDDVAFGVHQLELAIAIADRPALRDLARPLIPPAPFLRRRAWHAWWVRHVCDSGYHPCGSVPMGRDGDEQAATDSHGRVRGTEGLYVGDASLMPTIPTGNIHLPTLMIGERIAEFLRDEAR